MSPITEESAEVAVTERLLSEFGEVVEIFAQNPTFEVFLAIFEKGSQQLSPEVAHFVA
jgi:hypothetical protein